MADATAWQTGFALGSGRRQEQRAHKQALSDEELQGKIKDLIDQRSALVTKISSLDKDSPEYKQTFDALKQVNMGLVDTFHPQKSPGAIQKFGHLLTDHLKITSPEKRQEKEQALVAQKDKNATTQAQQDVAAGPLSPTETAVNTAKASSAGQLAKMQSTIKNLDTLFPNTPPETRTKWLNELAQEMTGAKIVPEKYFTQLATTEETLADGTKKEHYYRIPMDPLEQPEEVDFNGQKMVPKATAQKPPKGLKFDQVTGEVVNQDTAKRYSIRDIGKPDTPPEVVKMFEDSKAAMDEKQKNALALAEERGKSYGANRYTGFVDPNNPGAVIPATYGEAAKRGLKLATGANYRTMERMLVSSTAGPIGNEVVAFSTALQHADLLEKAAADLNNGDTRAWNLVKNDLATQFGDEAPTNFNTIATAYTREVNKALSSGHVTDSELATVGATIPLNASPEQIIGAIRAYRALMMSKIKIRAAQVAAGMAGVPFLAGVPLPSVPGNPTAGRYLHTATGANNHKIGTNDDPMSPTAKWFDIITGKPVK
jgi:hypothetical protein